MIDLTGVLYSTTFQREPDGSVLFTVATAEHGMLLSLCFTPEDALANAQSFASSLGLTLARPL